MLGDNPSATSTPAASASDPSATVVPALSTVAEPTPTLSTAAKGTSADPRSFQSEDGPGEADNLSKACWCFIDGPRNKGRFAVSKRKQLRMKAATEVPEVKDGVHAVEIDLQTMELRVRGQSLQALDSEIANDRDVRVLFGNNSGTLQCTMEGNFQHRKSRYLVGVGYTVDFWTPDPKLLELPEDYDRDYDPSELFPSEEWIGEIFEPIRKAWFVRPVAQEDVPFFMPVRCPVHTHTHTYPEK